MSVFNRADEGLRRGTRAVAILPVLRSISSRGTDARLEEFVGLASAIGIEVIDQHAFPIRKIRPATLFGQGQIEQIQAMVAASDSELVLIDNILLPVQQAKLEEALNAKVIDRTGLILEIFGERAATAEGRLQVELAHLDYQAGRLVRSWTHLERQRGGFGFLGGPGETQIEADRRIIRDRIARLRRELADLSRTRGLHRDRRGKAPWPVIALVGYTNAGKSTLFNRLTGAAVLAEDMLFATLDPTMRSVSMPGVAKVIISDTVGFVSELPTQLVAAFHATLEEVVAADLIVHVRDIAHEDTDAQRSDVIQVLDEIGAGPRSGKPIIEVWNKVDLLYADTKASLLGDASGRGQPPLISALSGEGVDALVQTLARLLTEGHELHRFVLPITDGRARAWLHAHGNVISESNRNTEVELNVRLSASDVARFQVRDLA